MQSAVQTGNTRESSGICFSREDTYPVFHRSCTFVAVGQPENKFRLGVLHLTDHVMYGSSRLGSHERKHVELLGAGSSPITARAGIFGLERGDKRYELSNHLGNVLGVVSDRRAKASCADTLVRGYWADVISTNDYYPFGMGMVERGDDEGYRYGFNGQERDDEVAGAGNSCTAEFWQYDSRLGRRWNVDPVVKTYASNYSVFSNNPLTMVDPDGAADFYNEAGVKVGTDGNPDGIIYILTSEADIKKAMHSYYGKGIMGFFRQLFGTKGRGTIQRDAFNGDVYVLPPPVVRQAMLDAVDASNGPSGLDEEGGFHEEGGYWGLDKNGNMVVVPAKPGPWKDPGDNSTNNAELNPFDAVDKELAASVVTILGTYHVHPSGKLAIAVKANNETSNVSSINFNGDQGGFKYFEQPPSFVDVKNAGERNLEINFVLGALDGKIFIYGSEEQNTRKHTDANNRTYNSYKASFPIEKFKELTPKSE